jgi:hypothetical protein
LKIKKIKNANLAPLMDSLSQDYVFVDNELQNSIEQLGFWRIFHKYGVSKKRYGYGVHQVVFCLIICYFLRNDSIRSFCGKCLSVFIDAGKDVIYDFFKREDIKWRQISLSVAKEVYAQHNIACNDSAFVVDDTIKKRSGKKVDGVSTHFDHTEGRCVMGQQILELGLSSPAGFIPLDRQIFIGEKNVHPLNSEFNDKRCAAAKDYETALNKTKHEMLEDMLKRVLNSGIKAKFLLGDSWFGCKKNINLALLLELTGIFRMKRSKLKYLYQGNEYTLTELYFLFIEKRLKEEKSNKDSRWKTISLNVQMNLSDDKKTPEWVELKLVFSSPKNPRKHEWAAFICTDIEMKDEEVLKAYALRWGVEVYFKEAKQNMGFLKEQTGNYVCHYASVHLTAIRYLLIFDSMLRRGACSFGEMRNEITGRFEMLTFASLLWEFFKAIIYGVLEQFERTIGSNVLKKIKETIKNTVEDFLEKALQLDESYLKNEFKAEKLGLLT